MTAGNEALYKKTKERMKVRTSYPGILRNNWPMRSLWSLSYKKKKLMYIISITPVTSTENRLFPAPTPSLNGVCI